MARSVLRELVCPFCREEGRQGHFIRWGSYKRGVGTEGGTRMKARIQRIRCTDCRHTHALFPESLIPCSSFPAELQIKVIQSYLDGDRRSLQELMDHSTASSCRQGTYRSSGTALSGRKSRTY